MQIILNTALPFFALIFCGYAAGRFNLLSEASISGVNAFVFYFALPTFLFNLMATSPIGQVPIGSFVAAYLGTGLAVFAVAALLGRALFSVRPGEAAVQGAAAVLGNTGYMGLPLVAAAFGDRAVVPLAIGLTLEATVLIPLTIILIEASRASAAGCPASSPRWPARWPATPYSRYLRRRLLLRDGPRPPHPGRELHGPPRRRRRTVRPLRPRRYPRRPTLSSGIAEVSYMTTFKLLIHPAAMYLATTYLFDVDPLWATVAILGASLPVAANVFIVAKQYDTYVDRTSSAILVSTIVSVVTVSALLTVLSP